MTEETTLRADAQRNRERILAAAEEVFLLKGASASLDDVAKCAGVGIGTLYRRFPTREDLLAAAYSDRFLTFAENSRARSTGSDPLSGLQAYLEELVQLTAIYRGLASSLGTVLQIGTPGCLATSAEGRRLLDQAQKLGVIRPDVTFDDLVCIATAILLCTENDISPKTRIPHLVNLFVNGAMVR